VNVSSVPEALFESQFFGHARGSFTGASDPHAGYFEQADGGTLYLDEIGELPMNGQVKLLRALETQSVTRIGETRPRSVDVQVVSSTNTDIHRACREARFRLDLLYRLNFAHIHLPPLSDRLDDVPLLAAHFLDALRRTHPVEVRGISPEALEVLARLEYPGNVRELRQMVERAAMFAGSGTLQAGHLDGRPSEPGSVSLSRSLCSFKEDAEAHMAYVLTRTRGDRRAAADILGVSVRQVQRRLSEMKKKPRWQPVLEELEQNRDSLSEKR
jgi:DNA-binding NtrC family response regulator